MLSEKDLESVWAEGAALFHRGSDRLRTARTRRTQTPDQRLGVTDPRA
jgi:hypothetical protein